MTMRTMRTAEAPSGRHHRSEHGYAQCAFGARIMGNILYIPFLSLSRYIIRESIFCLNPHEHGVAGLLST